MSGRDGHLGDRAAGLVDGSLDGDSRDRALVHIAGCTECRAEVDRQRQLKERLRACADPTLPDGLADRLRAIGRVPDTGSAHPLVPAAPSAAARTSPLSMPKPRTPGSVTRERPAGAARPAPGAGRGRRRRLRRVSSGAAVLALGVAAVLTVGPLRDEGPAVSPAVGRYTVEHARTTGGVPGADPGAGAVMTVSVNR